MEACQQTKGEPMTEAKKQVSLVYLDGPRKGQPLRLCAIHMPEYDSGILFRDDPCVFCGMQLAEAYHGMALTLEGEEHAAVCMRCGAWIDPALVGMLHIWRAVKHTIGNITPDWPDPRKPDGTTTAPGYDD